MILLTVRHPVRDYVRWRAAFEQLAAVREQAGIELLHIAQGADNANDVLVVMRADDLARAREFLASPDLRDWTAPAGVRGTPEIFLGATV